MPTDVSTTNATITHIYAGSMGTKKKATENTAHINADMMKALLLEPTFSVNFGETPPKIIQVSSPKVIKTV